MLRLPLSRCEPGSSRPTWLSSMQSVCSGCGSDVISCGRESLLMKVTRVPRATVMDCGHTALLRIRNVVAFGSVEHVRLDDGELELPPQPAANVANTAAETIRP